MDAITRRRALVGTIAGAVAATPMHQTGHAQGTSAAWPTRPVRIIVPFPAGGTTDLLARIFGAKLSEAFKQQVIVDNRASASGVIAGEMTAKAPPDGYTLLLAYHQHTANAALNPASTA